MPILVGLAGLIIAAWVWASRARSAAYMAGDLADMAGDVMAAARRFGFRRRYDRHPVDSTDDPKLMIGGLAVAFLELGGLPSAEDQTRMVAALGRHLHCDLEACRELAILGRWLMNESQGAVPAIPRLAKRLFRLSGTAGLMPLMAVLKDTGAADGSGLSDRQKEALAEIARIFRVN